MFLKTTAALAAAVAFSGAALLSGAPASAATTTSLKNSGYLIEARYGGPQRVNRVQATGTAHGKLVPYFVKKAKAERQAIQNWNTRVSRLYGSRFANWNRASAKSTTCSRSGASVNCRVSARPSGVRYGAL